MAAWQSALSTESGPRYIQIAEFIERSVAAGSLRPGDRLPAQRQLAAWLGVDLTTITRGLNEARRRRLVDARGALGTFIAAPEAELRQRVDLSMNIPPPPAGIDMEALLREGMSQVLMRSNVDLLMTYHVGGGSPADCEAGAAWLNPILGRVAQSRVAMCPGGQAALAAMILAFTEPGDAILSEPLTYPGLLHAAPQLGRRVEAVATDADGMCPDALDEACLAHGSRFIYLNPTLNNPTTVTMPEARRREIIAVAARHGARIVEDDPYWLFARHAPPPLARLAPTETCYIGTLSKCLSPGLRTAFVALPDEASRARFITALRSFSLMTAPIANALITQWIGDGTAVRLFEEVRTEARERQRIAAQTLGVSAGDGIHLWYELPRYWAPGELAAVASAEGLAVAPSTAFKVGEHGGAAIRISLGTTTNRGQLQAALRKLSALLADDQSARHEVLI
ncbi:aminotransferase-like domain-containing protein [Paraburkholderia adhaesiva]|uniref:aminotransferase-like domain-containing protein n=1 Tax=Paraburkholderia adhaesiva TaxID=2883244 RepID=UPI001F15F790|nr:PLP-dependent aminotransferase family protein [Paraburkholderia adhaesiva]